MEEQDSTAERNYSFGEYLPSAGIVGVIFALLTFAIGIFFGYQQINAEPTGSYFSPSMLSGVIICLVSAFAGMVAVWHFTKEVSPVMKLGQGAVLGFLTGAVIIILSVLLNEIWTGLIDATYTEKIIDATIANIEAMDIPESAKNDAIDGIAQSMEAGNSIWSQIFWGIPITGLVNLLTALIGVKIFAKKPEETF
ncbi:MAG TPA: DUF4199 domain-containing protein [Balneolaceae bacterium]|nr:DUF4199 domain-containing protein [Balneolaceae bacterium]